MFRCAGVLGALLALTLAPVGSAATRAVPDGPRLLYARDGDPLPGEEVISADVSGEHWFRVAHFPHASGTVERLAWFPDGSRFAFGGSILNGFGKGFTQAIFAVPAGGGRPKPLRGTGRGFAPVISPDGRTIAFARLRIRWRAKKPRFIGTSIWLVNVQGGRPRRLTPWKNRLVIVPSSFAPDGRTLAVIRVTPREREDVALQPLSGGRAKRIIKYATNPAFSPDGSRIAFVRPSFRGLDKRNSPIIGGDLFLATPDGTIIRRLTRTPDRREEGPSWDPSGERLAFTVYPAKPRRFVDSGIGSSIHQINADGTCQQRLLFTYGLSYHDPVWQPGPGREAGRIEC